MMNEFTRITELDLATKFDQGLHVYICTKNHEHTVAKKRKGDSGGPENRDCCHKDRKGTGV